MLPTIAQTSTAELEMSIMGWFVAIMHRFTITEKIAAASTKNLTLIR